VVLWRPRYKLSLRDQAEMFLTRGFIFSHEAVRGRSRYIDETYIKVRGPCLPWHFGGA
jgi:transposase-like protein